MLSPTKFSWDPKKSGTTKNYTPKENFPPKTWPQAKNSHPKQNPGLKPIPSKAFSWACEAGVLISIFVFSSFYRVRQTGGLSCILSKSPADLRTSCILQNYPLIFILVLSSFYRVRRTGGLSCILPKSPGLAPKKYCWNIYNLLFLSNTSHLQ